jgi:RNA polymerase sigma factor (sigma-70 family)
VRCYVKWSKVAAANDEDAYVYAILVNQLRTSRRRRWRGEHPSDDVEAGARPAVDDPAATSDLADVVQRALSSLPTPTRQVVVLRYFVDLTERQTADVLGIAPGTVKSRLSRGLTQLAQNPHLADLPGWSLP